MFLNQVYFCPSTAKGQKYTKMLVKEMSTMVGIDS